MKKLALAALVITAVLTSCTDAVQSKIGGYGSTYTVKVLGPDTVIVYHSTGKVISEDKSDGYYFEDASTHKLVEVSGSVIIEQE